MTDAGKSDEALAITNLLLERGELSFPSRSEIERFKQNPPPDWRIQIELYLDNLAHQRTIGFTNNIPLLILKHKLLHYVDHNHLAVAIAIN